MPETYLGDGVYATFDGYSMTLDLRAESNDVVIVMEPEVMTALIRFWDECRLPATKGMVMSCDGYWEGG